MKIAVVGGGNAGCFTALHYACYTQLKGIENIEIELVYNPEVLPERVGQATVIGPPVLLWKSFKFDWYNNPLNATFKSGILYEGWGKKNDKIFHSFPTHNMAMHFCPWEMQKYVLDSGYFNVRESNILDPGSIDADYVFDCRGRPEDFTDYDELKNPTNACILAKPNWDTTKAFWSRHVATPDGWTFIIPTSESSPSHDYCLGYCYNKNITSKEDAEKNLLDMFDVDIKKHIHYNNYVAKNLIIDDRIFLNGNRLFFLEPLESSSVEGYLTWAAYSFDALINRRITIQTAEQKMKRYVEQLQNFILWHYQSGSKYDTPFWKYAKKLKFRDADFNLILKTIRSSKRDFELSYGQWGAYSIRNWFDGT